MNTILLNNEKLLFMRVLKIINHLWLKLCLRKADPYKRAELLRDKFYHLGKNVELYTTYIGTEPYLINIEDNVCVASSVHFVNHDVSCFRIAKYLGLEREHVDKVGSIVLHENCFVGAFSILMPNSSVGKNSVVAAGSVVTKHIPDGEVWGGVPAKYIMKVDEYAKRVVEESEKYPWTSLKEKMPLNELIKMRQKYFFCDNKGI